MLQVALCDDRVEKLECVTGLAEEYARLHPELDSMIGPFQSGHGLGSRSIAVFMKKYDAVYSYKLSDGVFRFQFFINRPEKERDG